MSRFVYFKDEEVEGLDPEFVSKLDMARSMAGVPFTITSGLRSEALNDILPNSVKDSAHLRGLAVDLRCRTPEDRFRIVAALLTTGFKRIGLYARDGHIHVDFDVSLPQNVFWVEP